jgi:hypothetical protein
MGDIAAGIVIVVGLSLAWGCLGMWLACRCSARVANGIGLGLVLTVVAYAILLHGRLVLARVLPVSNVIVLGNLIPLGAAALTGLVLRRRSIPWWRRMTVGLILTGLAWYAVLCDLVGPPPAISEPRYYQGFCVQTSRASCSACAAAALLAEHGISANEEEMAELCLTRIDGTPVLGLYRGLKLKTRGSRWDVEVFCWSLEQLQEADTPVILLVHLPCSEVSSISTAWRGWLSRPDHVVVFFGVTDAGEAVLGDPAMGKRRWRLETLKRTWPGQGLRLVERGRKPPPP